jgi:hypothetical protein
MAEEQKSQKFIETNKAVATGVASVVAAVFTSRLGVAGTLIGTALTAMLITLGSAILKAQFEKASTKIAGLPNTVRGRFSTQQIRIPGKQNPAPNPESAARPEASGGRLSGLFSRLRALPSRLRTVPGFLRDLPSSQRRRVLVGGVLAGLVAAAIGLATVTGVEAVAGETLSCLVWRDCQQESASDDTEGSRTSVGRFFGGSTGTGGVPSGGQETPPGDGRQAPQQPGGQQPAQPGDASQRPGGAPQQSGSPDQGVDPPAQPGAGSGAGDGAEPVPPPPPSGGSSGKDQGQGPEGKESDVGQQKEDRGNPGPL